MRFSTLRASTGLRTLNRIVSIAVFGAVIGSASSLAALIFVSAVDFSFATLFSTGSVWMTILAPTAGGLIVGLVIHRSRFSANTLGPPQAIRQVQSRSADMPVKGGVVGYVTSLVSLATGASAGQYGPLTYFGASIGSGLTKLLPGGQAASIGIGCGVAAAISTAFNAPIAGIVFAHEVLLRHYSLRAFAPITVASTIGYIIDNVLIRRPPLFRVDPLNVEHAVEFIAFTLIGILGALLAVFYMRTMLNVRRFANALPGPKYCRPAVAGLLVGIVAIWLPEILGVGVSTIRVVIVDNPYSPVYLSLLLVAKVFATALCLGFGFVGGVFAPALFIGVLFGALIGSFMGSLTGDYRSSLEIYAICGMVAVTGPVIGAPLTTILIVFELTRNYDLTTAAMVSVVFSNLVAFNMFGRSFFDVELLRQGLDLSLGREKVVLDERSIAPWVSSDYTALSPTDTLANTLQTLIDVQRSHAYIVDDRGAYVGSLRLEQLLLAEHEGANMNDAVSTIAERNATVLTTNTTVWAAMDMIRDYVGESIPVVEALDNDTLCGVVFESTIVNAYLDVVYDIRREEQGLG